MDRNYSLESVVSINVSVYVKYLGWRCWILLKQHPQLFSMY